MSPPVISDAARQQWASEGWCLVEGLFPGEAVATAQAAMPVLFPTAEEFATDADPERNRPFHVDSHRVMPRFPFEDPSINELVVHDHVLDLAQLLLGVEMAELRLYQASLSAKYGDGALSDEQLLHADYSNHTLVVPRDEPGYQQLEMFVYLSDVTPETGATRMVPRSLTSDIPVERTYLNLDDYAHLYAAEVPASGPAGSILLYRPDVYHRGVRMQTPIGALHVAPLVQGGRDRLARFAGVAARRGGHGVVPLRGRRNRAPAHRPGLPGARPSLLDA